MTSFRSVALLSFCLGVGVPVLADENDPAAEATYQLPGRDTGVVIRRGPEIAPTPSTAVPRIDPVTRALEISAEAAKARAAAAAQPPTVRISRDRYVIVPQGWHDYWPVQRPKPGFTLVLKDEHFYLRLGDAPAGAKSGHLRP